MLICLYVWLQLIKEGKCYDDLTEVAKLFSMHTADVVEAGEDTQQTGDQVSAA